jgi:RimJ/RimL family protein N-acetyltransferase
LLPNRINSNLEDEMSGLRPAYPLRTERLDLRPHRMDDLDDLYAFHSRPEVVRYTPWPVRDREQTRVALEAKLTQDALTEPGQWLVLAIELRETGTVIGEVLLKWAGDTDRQGEIGFALHTDYQGKGLAFEAAHEVLRLGFEELGLHRICAVLDDRNTASAGLLERLGMHREAHLIHCVFFKGEWANEYIYALREDDWRAGQA